MRKTAATRRVQSYFNSKQAVFANVEWARIESMLMAVGHLLRSADVVSLHADTVRGLRVALE